MAKTKDKGKNAPQNAPPDLSELSFDEVMKIIIKAPKEVVDQKMKDFKKQKKSD